MVDLERRVEEIQCHLKDPASQVECQDREILQFCHTHMRVQYRRDNTQSLIYGDIICAAPKTLQD